MHPNPEDENGRSSSCQDLKETDEKIMTPERQGGLASPAIRPSCAVPAKSIMDDHEVEDNLGEVRSPEDDKNTSIEENFVDFKKRSSSISNLSLESNEWENTAVQNANCPACQDPLQLKACEEQMMDQFEFVARCRHPKDFLAMFKDGTQSFDCAEQAVAGFYHISKECEYCGAASIEFCSSHCTRPKSFFQRKRPPFCAPGITWDSETDVEIIVKEGKGDKDGVNRVRSPLRSLLFGR